MAERLPRWREVRLGFLVVAALAAGLFAFWIQRGQNPFFLEAYTLVLFIEDAKGLEEGAPVMLSGVRVGDVRAIDVIGGAAPVRREYPDRLKGLNIRVVLEVQEGYRNEITDRSRARISTSGVSGVRYVRIDKSGLGGRPLQTGERLDVVPAVDVEHVLDRGRTMLEGIAAINRHSREIGSKLEARAGTMGRIAASPSDNPLAESFERMNAAAERVLRSLESGGGTFGLERRTQAIRVNVARLQKSLDEIRSRAEKGGSLGSFANDPALPAALARLNQTTTELMTKLERGEGSLGRFVNDPELFDQLQILTLQLDSLTVQIMEDPLGSVDLDLH
jgi:phospholipid/cholesterol/gamma-HCH transport system substrate-binding protein